MISKINISGQVSKSPEKRFTENNIAITRFEINIGTQEKVKLLECKAIGKIAEDIAGNVKLLKTVMLNGRLIFEEKKDKKINSLDSYLIMHFQKSIFIVPDVKKKIIKNISYKTKYLAF